MLMIQLFGQLKPDIYDHLKMRLRKRLSEGGQATDFINRAETLIADIELKSIRFSPRNRLTIISDKDDNKLLELAKETFELRSQRARVAKRAP